MEKQTQYKIIQLHNLKIQLLIDLEVNEDLTPIEVRELTHKINKIERIIKKLKRK